MTVSMVERCGYHVGAEPGSPRCVLRDDHVGAHELSLDLNAARKAIARVRGDLGESRVRAGRDHDVLEAARWAAELLAEVERLTS